MAAPSKGFGWLDVDRIAELLHATHRDTQPYSVRFTDLRRLVEALPGFVGDPDHPVNEKILETIQALWLEEREDRPRNDDEDD